MPSPWQVHCLQLAERDRVQGGHAVGVGRILDDRTRLRDEDLARGAVVAQVVCERDGVEPEYDRERYRHREKPELSAATVPSSYPVHRAVEPRFDVLLHFR